MANHNETGCDCNGGLGMAGCPGGPGCYTRASDARVAEALRSQASEALTFSSGVLGTFVREVNVTIAGVKHTIPVAPGDTHDAIKRRVAEALLAVRAPAVRAPAVRAPAVREVSRHGNEFDRLDVDREAATAFYGRPWTELTNPEVARFMALRSGPAKLPPGMSGAINGDDGGLWEPAAAIVIGGAGVSIGEAAALRRELATPPRGYSVEVWHAWLASRTEVGLSRFTWTAKDVAFLRGAVESGGRVIPERLLAADKPHRLEKPLHSYRFSRGARGPQ